MRSCAKNIRLDRDETLLEMANAKTEFHARRSPHTQGWLGSGIGRAELSLNYVVRQQDSQVELFIDLRQGGAKNKAAFKLLCDQREAIEADFKSALDWQELPDSDGCRIRRAVAGGYRSLVEEWPKTQAELVDSMILLDKALRARVALLPI
jgi:Domain of unknown function (DUF4268)